MPITIPLNVVDASTLDLGLCTHSAGHCFGSDGGTEKVPSVQGGNQEAWTFNITKTVVISKDNYSKCQYCGKYTKAEKIN